MPVRQERLVICGAITRQGIACRAAVVKGGDRCRAHSGGVGARFTEAQLLRIVANAAQDDWRAATWLLNRLYPVKPVAPAVPPSAPQGDPFAEVDELAERRIS